MRILADENIPAESIRILRDAGHDILAASKVMPRMADTDLLVRATEDGRLILTFDLDFGVLTLRGGLAAPFGILLLRFVPAEPGEAGRLLVELFELPDLQLASTLSILDRERLRQRPLET